MDERIALLGIILNSVQIDMDWVVQEYLRRCKARAWKPENTAEALKCWNLERVMSAEVRGEAVPAELSMSDLLGEGAAQDMVNLSLAEDEAEETGDIEDAMQV